MKIKEVDPNIKEIMPIIVEFQDDSEFTESHPVEPAGAVYGMFDSNSPSAVNIRKAQPLLWDKIQNWD